MNQVYATTRANITLIGHLLNALQHIIDSDPLIMTAGVTLKPGHELQLTKAGSDPDFFNTLPVPFVIRSRDSDLFPWQVTAHHAGVTVFRLLDDDELSDNFHLDPSGHVLGPDGPVFCPQCSKHLRCGDGTDKPPLYCDPCRLGWNTVQEVLTHNLHDDPGEEIYPPPGRPRAYEDEQHQAETECNAQGVTT